MDFDALISNLTNPTLLFFILGIVAVLLKSDLQIPESSSKFISLYLLFAIGFKGGQELAHSDLNAQIAFSIVFGLVISSAIPLYSFFILKKKLNVHDSAAVAAAYGSVSAVTFVTAAGFMEMRNLTLNGHMIAIMALMESPAIVTAVVLLRRYDSELRGVAGGLGSIVKHSFTNGSVLMILGSLIIGIIADSKQAEGIKPFTTDIFKGFLALFLLEMGMVTAKRFESFKKYGKFATIFGILSPLVNGSMVAFISHWVTADIGDRFIFSILAASASYIAVPAAMRLAAPKADPGLYIPMALGVTFPINLTIGIPLFYAIVQF